MGDLHGLNEAFQPLCGFLIEKGEVLEQFARKHQLVKGNGTMFPQELLAPTAPEANISGIRLQGKVGEVVVSGLYLEAGMIRFEFHVLVCSAFRNENSGYDEGFTFRHNRYYFPQMSQSHDVLEFTSYIWQQPLF